MSREIKFQILWVKNNFDFTKSIEKHHTTLERLTSNTDQFHYCDVEVIAKRQYTGIKDKNGVEIYEGDIVNGGFDNCEVKYSTDRAQFVIDSFAGEVNLFKEKIDKCGVVVIGNIHQNPELLK